MSWKGGYDGKCLSHSDFFKHVSGLDFGQWRPQFLVLHNTGSPTLKQWMATKGGEGQRVKNLARYYQMSPEEGGPANGPWNAGPHLFVSPSGIFLGTPLTVPGVHSPSWNAFSWGLEMAGDFDKEKFDPKLRDNAVYAIAVLYSALGRDPGSLRLHKEDPGTTHKGCPGKNVSKADMIARIKTAMLAMHPGGHIDDPNKGALTS